MNSYIKLLWKYYKNDGDFSCRDKLVNHYFPFIKRIAKNIYSKLPNTIQLSEVESYANVGLLDAIEKYNHEKGVEFESYAKIRISGAIYDEIRKQDWLPRSTRASLKKQKDDIANYGEMINIDGLHSFAQDYDKSVNDMLYENPLISSFDLYENFCDEKCGFTGSSSALQSIDFAVELEKKISLKNLLLKLKKTDRKVIYFYYFEGYTFKEIGKIINLTESRISQIHKKALIRLREIMDSGCF